MFSSPFFSLSLIFFLILTCIYLCALPFFFLNKKKPVHIALAPQASTQYSADKDREEKRLGRDVEGNDNARAEFIH